MIFLNRDSVKGFIPSRPEDAYKSSMGHVLIIAGSRGLSGAAVLASQACIRTGAGLVTLCIPECLHDIMAIKLTEIMTLPCDQTSQGTLSVNAYKTIMDFINTRKINVLALGPGLSTHTDTVQLVKKIISSTDLACVLDADGINAFKSDGSHRVKEFVSTKAKILITPHPGELARLVGMQPQQILQDRVASVRDFASRNNVMCILKGHQTLISDGEQVFANTTGNPGMATAGSGDVLTGILAGLIAQGAGLSESARLGVYMHGLAGDLARDLTGEMGLVATDIVLSIPMALQKLIK